MVVGRYSWELSDRGRVLVVGESVECFECFDDLTASEPQVKYTYDQGSTVRVLEAKPVPGGRQAVRTKHGWSYMKAASGSDLLELQEMPTEWKQQHLKWKLQAEDEKRGRQGGLMWAGSGDSRDEAEENLRLDYRHFRGWIVPDRLRKKSAKKLLDAVRKSIGEEIVADSKVKLRKLKAQQDHEKKRGGEGAPRDLALTPLPPEPESEPEPEPEPDLELEPVPGERESLLPTAASVASSAASTLSSAVSAGSSQMSGVRTDAVKLEPLDAASSAASSVASSAPSSAVTSGELTVEVAAEHLSDAEVSELCPLLITSEGIGLDVTADNNQAFEAALAQGLERHESMWAAGARSTKADTDREGSDLARTMSVARHEGQDKEGDAEGPALFEISLLGNVADREACKEATKAVEASEDELENKQVELAKSQAEAAKLTRVAQRAAADFDKKLRQVLSVLNNEDMARSGHPGGRRGDLRGAREKEQVVRIEAENVTILWVNCSIGRVDELLRDLDRECVEGPGHSWLGKRYGVVTVLDVCVAKPTPTPFKDENPEDASAHRLPIEEIYASINSGAELDANFYLSLICAGVIAAVGLFTNSSVMLVASMLISPMMGPILAITFGMAIKTRVLQRVARKELRANLVGRPGDENLSPLYQGPIIPGDSKHGIVILPRKKRPGTTQSRRRLAKVHSILYETGRQEDDQAEALNEKHEVDRRNTIFVVQLMDEKHEWATEWHDDAVEDLVETSGKWTRPDGKPMERVSAANAEKKLQPLQPGEKVPYLDHNAQVDADKGRPTVEEVRARYTTPAEQDDAILGNTIEEEAMYEVKWNPVEILDRAAYQASLAEVERGEKDEKGNLKVLRVEANKEVTFKTKDSSLAKWYLMRKGAWSEAVAALVAWLMGFAVSPLFMVLTRWEHFSGTFWGWPPLTDEMVGRGDYYNFFVRPPSLRPCSTALKMLLHRLESSSPWPLALSSATAPRAAARTPWSVWPSPPRFCRRLSTAGCASPTGCSAPRGSQLQSGSGTQSPFPPPKRRPQTQGASCCRKWLASPALATARSCWCSERSPSRST